MSPNKDINSKRPEIIALVDQAAHKLNARIDAVLEDWITKHKPEDRERPLLKTKDGKVYSMKDILVSIRHQTEIGKEFEANLVKLAIDLFSKQKPIA